jgi:hypothetical protein
VKSFRFIISLHLLHLNLLICCAHRNLQTLSRVSWQLVNQLYGELFRCSNIFKRRCKIWPTLQNSAASQQPLKLVSLISASGMVRLMTRTSILFVLVRIVFISMPLDDTDVFDVALDPNYKVAYAKDKWAPHFFETGMHSLGRVVCRLSSRTSIVY